MSEVLKIEDYKFIIDKINKGNFAFSTAENHLDININNINEIKDSLIARFKIKEIAYSKQVHSDIVTDFYGEIKQGDAIISTGSKLAVGVFTADCVPILIYDYKNKTVAAVHSGWKGTYSNILGKTINKMIKDYKCSSENIIVYIGPHIHSCCYEVGEEIRNKFLEAGFSEDVIEGNNLNLNKCIKDQLSEMKINNSQILEIPYCTKCSKEYKFHSYRRDNKSSGRNFSFVFFD